MLSLKSNSLLSCAILLSVTSGATLASPINAELLQHMKTIIAVNNHTTSYFIGFKAKHTTNGTEFRSEEGILLEDVPETFNLVDLLDSKKGECLCMDGTSIRIESCWSRLPFICYTNKTSGGALTDIPAVMSTRKRLHCGPDYKLYPTGCYKVHKEDMNWTSAYWKCALEGAYLAVINDSDEAKVVTDIVTDSGFKWCWVGLRDVTGSQDWTAVTGEKLDDVYHAWARSASHDNEHACATLLFTEKLDDYSCSPEFLAEANSIWQTTSGFVLTLPQFLKTKVFDQYVLPVMTYGAETWTLTVELVHQLQIACK